MLPYFVRTNQVRTFKFFADSTLHTGMTFKQKLYKLHRRYTSSGRLDAMCAATAIANQGYQTVVTVSDSDQEYVVWVDVSFTEDPGDEPPAPTTPCFELPIRKQFSAPPQLENVEHS